MDTVPAPRVLVPATTPLQPHLQPRRAGCATSAAAHPAPLPRIPRPGLLMAHLLTCHNSGQTLPPLDTSLANRSLPTSPPLTPQCELQAHTASYRVLCICLHCAMKLLGHRLADLFSLAFTEDQAPGSSSTAATKWLEIFGPRTVGKWQRLCCSHGIRTGNSPGALEMDDHREQSFLSISQVPKKH